MKKLIALFGLILVTSPAFAGAAPASEVDFPSAFTVGSSGSETEKTTFTIDETPFLFFHLPNPSTSSWDSTLDTAKLKSKWDFLGVAGGAINADTEQTFSTGDKYWVSLSSWATVKAIGNWEIKDLKYEFKDGSTVKQKGDFTGGNSQNRLYFNVTSAPVVTPEPASMALFGLGALALGARRMRRKKA